MPKQKITKEMVVKAAFELAREGGMENVMVKRIADKLNCSVQPVYCYCKNMEGLKEELVTYTESYLADYMRKHMNEKERFKSIGIAYASFAKEEPSLYRLYFLRRRETMHSLEEIIRTEANPAVAASIAQLTGLSLMKAKELHKHMMIYNVGISFMLTSLGEETNIKEVSELLDQAYSAFMKQVTETAVLS